jgi:hypothetical protein
MCSASSALGRRRRRCCSARLIASSACARSALPSATARLRRQRAVADAADRAAFGAAQELGLVPGPQLQQRGAVPSGSRASKSGSGLRCAYLFQGHTSWQSSQP